MTEAVLFEELEANGGAVIGVATLNAERKLNSLNLDMVHLLTRQLTQWQEDERVVCVWLQGAGEKAFCAGGDVRSLRDQIVEQGAQTALPDVQAFFENEYRLDYLIHRYSKPIVVWGHGIVMGGGIGLMSGASHRVVTEASRLAMPEISIGLYPDVGGTWFLNHAPGRSGLFLGLTGASINAADALFVGMADRFAPAAEKSAVMKALQQQAWTDNARKNEALVSRVLQSVEKKDAMPDSNVVRHYELIQSLTDGATLNEIAEKLSSFSSDDAWLQKAVDTFKAGSAITAHLVFEQLQRGKKLSLEQVFQMELVMSLQCALHQDFPEGVRALLVDKDGKPQWQFAAVSDVPEELIKAHFKQPWPQNPLGNL